jgi:hypothetical protein
MPSVGFEPTVPVFKREKTFHALDRPAPVIDRHEDYSPYILSFQILDIWVLILLDHSAM